MISEMESRWIIEGLANVEASKLIDGYDNYYITTRGRVYNAQTNRYLKTRFCDGYEIVNLYKEGKMKTKTIHRLMANAFIPNLQNKKCVDHIDHDKTNNTIENLRFATHRENQYNKSKQKNNTSGFIGVSLQKSTKKWVAQINTNGKHIHIGCYETAEEASQAYQEQAKIHFGEFHNSK